ncbi:MAG: class I SAM-dependent methyltransferase [Clostridiales bacterium]|nr:class I SAM-dependent methyltransferase [Clostridiales bacterium]
MDNRKELGATFDTAASAYDKMRPGYPQELYHKIFEYIKIDEKSLAAEVGSGTGQATGPVLKTGCSLTAVEYGENLSAVLKDKYKDYDRFNVVTGKFEDVKLEEDSYDLIFSATAFHWVPEETGYPKVYSLLKEGGAFARFANRPRTSEDNPELAREIDSIYESHYNRYYGIKSGSKPWFTEEKAKEISLIPAKYGFTDIEYHLFFRKRVFTASEYIQLLGTYSDHIAIEDSIRHEFFAKIEDAVLRHGGTITISDTLDLELARKPYSKEE